MEILTIETILLALSGMIIHILMKVGERKDKGVKKVSFKYWIKDRMNWIRLALSIVSTFALLVMSPDLLNLFGGFQLKDGSSAMKLFAFGAGYLNHSLVRNVLKIFKKIICKQIKYLTNYKTIFKMKAYAATKTLFLLYNFEKHRFRRT